MGTQAVRQLNEMMRQQSKPKTNSVSTGINEYAFGCLAFCFCFSPFPVHSIFPRSHATTTEREKKTHSGGEKKRLNRNAYECKLCARLT